MKNLIFILMFTSLFACQNTDNNNEVNENDLEKQAISKLQKYVTVNLKCDLSLLSPKEKQIIPILIEVSKIMDDIFWKESYGDKKLLLNEFKSKDIKKFFEINYGPWDRLDGDKPISNTFDKKPLGANFYPFDLAKKEFDFYITDSLKNSEYSVIKRNKNGEFSCIPYNVLYAKEYKKVAQLLTKAADLAENEELKNYLLSRANAFLTNDYYQSDMTWLDMTTSNIDFVVGPIENYEDQLYGKKAAHEAILLIKDKEWTDKIANYANYIYLLQEELPINKWYKKDKPSLPGDLAVYNAIYYAGNANTGGKVIAINLPNNQEVQLKKGARRLELKNIIKAKFDKILVPVSKMMIINNLQKNIKFQSFFENVLFHEIAHGIGIKNTVNAKGTVKDALKETYSAMEECKADILGLYMITTLNEKELINNNLMDNYATFVASIFRTLRFGSTSAHAKGNLIIFNHLKQKEAIKKTSYGAYRIDIEKMKEAITSLASAILKIQGDGDYEFAKKLTEQKMGKEINTAVKRINAEDIPSDIIFNQGIDVLGL